MHHTARLAECEGDLGLFSIPVLAEDCSILGFERREFSRRFQVDLQLGDVDVVGITEITHEAAVRDLSHGLVASSHAAISGYIENDGICRDLFGDLLQEHLKLGAVGTTCGEEGGGSLAEDVAVCQGETKELGETGLT